MSLQTAIAAALAENNATKDFSGVVQVRQGGESIFSAAYGYANRSDNLPNTINTRFATASGCKIFTAIATMQLIEAGKFTLETPLTDVLDLSYAFDSAITVRHLLTHSSGLPDYYDEDELSDEDCIQIWEEKPVYTLRQPGDYLPLFLDHPMKFTPGERFHYNNGAFVVLAELVQQQSGQPFPTYVTEHVFKPAGMTNSGYFWLNALPANTASGYMLEEDGSAKSNIYLLPPIGSGDGGAYVTAPDWANFWDALLSHKLLSPAMTEAMRQPHISCGHEKLDKRYGYGIWLTYRDDAIYERYVVGADFGVGMVSARFPAYDVEMTILDNTGEGVWGLWGALVKVFDEQLGG